MAKLMVNVNAPGSVIDKNIYGHFAEHLGRCIYEGIWVGEGSPIPNTRGIRNDVVAALKQMGLSVLRWPGGCFADNYHWMDGVGPKETRKKLVNTNWGGVTENNHFGTHEFLDLCDQVGCEPYVCGNMGSGTVREMQEWVEYMTFAGVSPMADLRRQNGREEPWRVKYFGVGNENWGCGGSMRPEYYADEYRRYNTYLRNFGDNKLFRIACGADMSMKEDYNWTEVLMREAGKYMDGLSLHYYAWLDMHEKGPATGFTEAQWHAGMKVALRMDKIIADHAAIMDKYDPDRRVAMIVDEWGTWYTVEPGTNPSFLYQQNSLRDALVAGLTLNIFNNHAERVRMANIAQIINVLQSVILTEGAKMILTPTYHVFEMYKAHQGAKVLPTEMSCGQYTLGDSSVPNLNVSASVAADGAAFLTICNTNPHAAEVLDCDLAGIAPKAISGRVLTADQMDAHNTFERADAVKPTVFTDVKATAGGFTATIPPMSVVAITMK